GASTEPARKQKMETGFCDIFLSYASEDADLIVAMKERLTTAGYEVRVATMESLVDHNAIENISEEAGSYRFYAVFLTSRSVESEWVRHELSTAKLHEIESRATLIFLLYEDCAIPPVLYEKRFINFKTNPARGLRDLVHALAGHDISTLPRLGGLMKRLREVVNGNESLCIAVDLGGTKTYVSLMNGAGERFYDKKFPTEGHGDAEQLLTFLLARIGEVMDRIRRVCEIDENYMKARIKAVGLAFPGPTHFDTGVVLGATNLRIGEFPLGQRLAAALGIPTFVDNDVNLGVLGESWKGVARGYRNVVGIIISARWITRCCWGRARPRSGPARESLSTIWWTLSKPSRVIWTIII
ncbi:MAG: ROK family protein, partial [Pseudonocardiaceae bacterium]